MAPIGVLRLSSVAVRPYSAQDDRTYGVMLGSLLLSLKNIHNQITRQNPLTTIPHIWSAVRW